MAKAKKNYALDDEDSGREMVEAADRISDLFDEYEITPAEIASALQGAAQATLAEMYPELAAEAE